MLLKNSIRKRTFWYFSFGMLIIILTFALLFSRYFFSLFRERIELEQTRTTNTMADVADSIFADIKQSAYFLSCNEELAKTLVNRSNTPLYVQRNQVTKTFNITTGTLTTTLMRGSLVVMLVDTQFELSGDQQGDFSLTWNAFSNHRIYSLQDVLEEDWYLETARRKGQIYAFWDENNPNHVFFAHTLRSIRIADARFNSDLGVILYMVPKVVLSEILDNSRVTDNTIAMLVFGENVFLSTDPERFPPEHMGGSLDSALSAIPSGGKTKDVVIDGQRYTASATAFQGDWKGVLLVPANDVWVYVSAPIPVMLLIVLLLLVIAALISALFSKQLVDPIIRLSAAMVQVRDDRSLPLPVEAPASKDEIETLYSSYNRMLEWIQRLLEEAVEEAEKLRSAQLKTMQAQINPHFIYNTLDSISCCALMEGNDDIVVMVSSLIAILKYSVNFSRTTVSLREEIDYLQHYIRIQALRYKSGFQFICDVPEKYYSVRVSQIILQPLVENALFHAQRDGDVLRIRLYCEEEDGQLRIHVEDNGTGGSAEQLNKMLKTDEEEGGIESLGGRGIGIRNVNTRIRLLIGGDSGLHYEQLPNGGLDAIIKIPLELSYGEEFPAPSLPQ